MRGTSGCTATSCSASGEICGPDVWADDDAPIDSTAGGID